jgi:hypothetical protein
MASYRLYCLDGLGHISLADWIEASSDDDAVAEARRMKIGGSKCEVWDGKRLVARLGAQELSGTDRGPAPQPHL